MEKIIVSVLLVTVVALMGCTGTEIGIKPVQPCIVDVPQDDGTVQQIEFNELCDKFAEEGKVSLICNLRNENNLDACYLHRAMEVISQEGLVLEGYTYEEFEEWANEVIVKIENGITYGLLKNLVLAQFTKINKMLGAQVLILGDMFLELPQDELIPMGDIIMVISSIEDLKQEVKTLSIWLE
jgi:hypothetical protein